MLHISHMCSIYTHTCATCVTRVTYTPAHITCAHTLRHVTCTDVLHVHPHTLHVHPNVAYTLTLHIHLTHVCHIYIHPQVLHKRSHVLHVHPHTCYMLGRKWASFKAQHISCTRSVMKWSRGSRWRVQSQGQADRAAWGALLAPSTCWPTGWPLPWGWGAPDGRLGPHSCIYSLLVTGKAHGW